YPPPELGDRGYTFNEEEKVIVNVGSVGQPRDGDPRACYAIMHADRIEFVRVEYDIDITAKKIHAIEELSDWLGDRLYEGREGERDGPMVRSRGAMDSRQRRHMGRHEGERAHQTARGRRFRD